MSEDVVFDGLDDVSVLVFNVSQSAKPIVLIIGDSVIDIALGGHTDQRRIGIGGHLGVRRINANFIH